MIFNGIDDDFFMVSDGTVKLEDLKGYEGVFIRKTIYKAKRRNFIHILALWILGFENKNAQDIQRCEKVKEQ